MTKKSKNTFIVIFAFICLLAVFLAGLTFPKTKATDQVNYKKKIVSVVFDNSGSMQTENRPELAKYSLQMLASMLGKEDELIVCPMNHSSSAVFPIVFDLTQSNRENEIANKIINNKVLNPSGGTPASSIDEAISQLRSRGLKLGQELDNNSEQNVEYWLVMLTDGAFTNYNTTQQTGELVESKIKDYAGLNTIYLSFGNGAVDLTDPSLSLNKNYPFNAYYVTDTAKLVDSMKSVANKILGKYGAGNNYFSVNSNKVTINVENFDFAMNSITIFAQNCGAKIQSVLLNGKSISPQIYNKLSNCGLSMEEGYIAVIKDTGYISGGQLEIEFDKNVSDVSILVEPALHIGAYLEYFDGNTWQKTDMQYINSNMSPGDKIRVGYKVYSSSDNKEVDTKSIFGNHVEKVTYCGKGYAIGEEIELQVGANELYVSIVVLNGAYTMQTSLTCYIESNPTFYRIQSDVKNVGGKKSELEYKVFVDDKQIGYSDFSNYVWSVIAKDPNGNEIDVSKSLEQNGIIKVWFDGEGKQYGTYTIEAKVTSNETNLSRVTIDKIQVVPNDIQVNCLTTDLFTTTEFLLNDVQKKVEFALKLEGNDETFERDIINYTITINGKDIKDKCTIENGKLVFTISKDTLYEVSNGNYQIKVNVSTLGGISDQAQYDFAITDSAFVIQNLDIGTNEFDRYNVSKAGAGLYFAVYKDGIPLSVEQINQALENKEIIVDYDPSGWITLLPCALDIVVEEIDGQAVIACKVGSDVFKPLDNLLGSFIFDNEEVITVRVNKVACSASFIITEVSFISRVIRWIIMLLIILFILHLLLFALGFIIAKPLPKGTLLNFNVDEQNMSDTARIIRCPTLNLNKEIFLWHLSRFIPFRELKNQKPKVVNREIEFSIDKVTKGAVCKFKTKRKRCLIKYKDFINIKAQAREVQEVYNTCRRGKRPPRNLKLTKKEFMKFFNQTKNCVKNEGSLEMGTWYGIHVINDNGTIGNRVGFYVFIPKNLN